MKADTLLRDKNGVEELWYSEDFVNRLKASYDEEKQKINDGLKREIEAAYYAGLNRGIRVELHASYNADKPAEPKYIKDFVNKFYEKINEEFKKAVEKHEVWGICNKIKS